MPLPIPSSLSPSKVSTFRDCALAFRLSAIDKIPEPPTIPAVKGTTVHRALELLFGLSPEERTSEAAVGLLRVALDEMTTNPEYVGLSLDDDAARAFADDATTMVNRYFAIENPSLVQPVGLELKMEADLDGVLIRGIIDRLEINGDGDLIVTDYKTGRTPTVAGEQQKLGGVHFYSLLCERVLGKRPVEVQLMYLGSKPEIIVARPTEQSTRGVEKRLSAVWNAVKRACETDDFRPKPGPLCNWCSFKAYCPAFGGTLPPPPSGATPANVQRGSQT